jgi:predicted nucleic acid-binding protein
MRNILLDTGAVVALLRPGDRLHATAQKFFAALRPGDNLLTTWPVITECAFLLRNHEALFWEWLSESGVEVVDFAVHDIASMRKWRAGYKDREVDFADASLVWLGQKRHTNLVATTDFDDFETYRLHNGKRFKLLLNR